MKYSRSVSFKAKKKKNSQGRLIKVMKGTDAITVGGYLSSSQMQRQGKLTVSYKRQRQSGKKGKYVATLINEQ